MMIRHARLLALTLAVCACAPPSETAAQAEPADSLFVAAPSAQWRLPNRLREISGLAVSPDGRVFAHDDEQAVIYEFDMREGRLIKAFALGDPVVRGDFEGLAIAANGVFWMTTSSGQLYRFDEGEDGQQVSYETFDAGLVDICEIEGLAYLPAEESLILACKSNHARAMRDTISLYLWPLNGAAQPWLQLPEERLAGAAGVRRFRPSGVEVDAESGRIIVISAMDAALAELDSAGAILSARTLANGHVQAEGVTVLPGGDLLIADEGAGARALLSRYARRHD